MTHLTVKHVPDDVVDPVVVLFIFLILFYCLFLLLLQFPLSTVVQCSSHQDNKRLFGFVLQSTGGRGDGRAVCYIFESNNDGEKVFSPFNSDITVLHTELSVGLMSPCPSFIFQICDSIGLAKQIAFHSEMVRIL